MPANESRPLPERVMAQLRRSALLADVGENDLRLLDPPPEIIHLRAGETLIRQGDCDCDYYVLIGGRLKALIRDTRGATVATGIVRPGEGVGEMALLTNEPRSATVVACLDSEIVRFPRKSFLDLIDSNPAAATAIARLTIRRFKEQFNGTGKGAIRSTIAVIPATAGVDANALALDLAKELRTFGRAIAVGTNTVAAATWNPDRCEQVENDHEYVVYAATGTSDAWSRHCIHRCDVVLLAAGSGSPQALPLDALIRGRDRELRGRLELLMVHGTEWNRTGNTKDWIDRTGASEHHHIRAGNRSDFSRLARMMAGAANNLVLSGGGARTFAQIGALRAFAEAGIPIDRACGSSMGAFIAALYCYGGDFSELTGRAREEMMRLHPGRDLTLPLLSLTTGRRLRSAWMSICKTWRIEDMPYRYFCLSSDLGEAELVEHFDGPVWAAVRASAAMPGLVPPFLVGGRVLADGGVLNNLPVDVMRERFSGSIVAIDVSSNNRLRYGARYEMRSPSGFRILWDRINPFASKEPVPNIAEVLYRTAVLGSDRHARVWREKADLLIAPAVQNFRVSDFARFDELVEAGYRDTIEALARRDKDPAGECLIQRDDSHARISRDAPRVPAWKPSRSVPVPTARLMNPSSRAGKAPSFIPSAEPVA
jgi:NTE family protein